jgi:hypothetical protein
MARTINDLYNLYQFILRKERGVFITFSQFTQNLDAAQLDLVTELFKGYGENQIIHDGLRPFRVYQPFTSDVSGFVTFQSNFLHPLGNPFSVFGSTVTTIKMVNEDELSFALTSQLRPVTNAYPIAVDTSNGFSIYPQSTQTGAYWYLRRPATPVYGFTQVGRVVTYDPATSTQLEWDENYWNNILAKALLFSGVNMDEDGILKFAQTYNQQSE